MNTTAAQLRTIMREHGLTQAKVAELASVSVKTVEGWLASETAASFRSMPARHLHLILARLPGKPKTAKRGRKA